MELPAGVLLLLGHVLLLAMDGGGCGSARENEKRNKITSGPPASVRGRGAAIVYAYNSLPVYSVVFLWETKNYNDMLQNRRIVTVFF